MAQDDPNQSPANAPGSAGAGDDKNPLDILEEILQENKKGQEVVEKAEAELESRQQAEQAAIIEQQRQQDEVALQQQLTDLQNVAETPEIKAREETRVKEAEEAEQQKQEETGFEIKQIDHTKITKMDQ